MKFTKIAVAFGLTVFLGSSAFAGDKVDRLCSPGWYKNNGLDTWYDGTCGSDYTCDELLAMLNANCSEGCDMPPGVLMNYAADYIVSNGLLVAKVETCEEAYDDK